MARKFDGGPAFPQLTVETCERDGHGDVIEPFTSVSGGMSLRDWFAGQALSGMMAIPGRFHEGDAEIAYDAADAMLAQRAK